MTLERYGEVTENAARLLLLRSPTESENVKKRRAEGGRRRSGDYPLARPDRLVHLTSTVTLGNFTDKYTELCKSNKTYAR